MMSTTVSRKLGSTMRGEATRKNAGSSSAAATTEASSRATATRPSNLDRTQLLDVRDVDVPSLHRDQARVGEVVQDAGTMLRRQVQTRGEHTLAHGQRHGQAGS